MIQDVHTVHILIFLLLDLRANVRTSVSTWYGLDRDFCIVSAQRIARMIYVFFKYGNPNENTPHTQTIAAVHKITTTAAYVIKY